MTWVKNSKINYYVIEKLLRNHFFFDVKFEFSGSSLLWKVYLQIKVLK